jgi:hypothetical protein
MAMIGRSSQWWTTTTAQRRIVYSAKGRRSIETVDPVTQSE